MKTVTIHDRVIPSDGGELLCCGAPMTRAHLLSGTAKEEVWTCGVCKSIQRRGSKPPGVRGGVRLQLMKADGTVVWEHEDHNIFTDVGRNWLASLISYNALTASVGDNEPATSKRRYDGVRYMMVGKGQHIESNSVVGLADPVPFTSTGHYLAQIAAPNELPATGISAIFERVYGLFEISTPTVVEMSEVGLFFSGPASGPLDPTIPDHAPIAYKVFEPIPKTTELLFSVRWEIKF